MIISNSKMNAYLNRASDVDVGLIEGLEFSKLRGGYFFSRMVDENIQKVANVYAADQDSDWSGFEYGANKIHLEDELQGSISEITSAGAQLVKVLFEKFKEDFPLESPLFWLSCQEFVEYPSVTLGFYIKRPGMIPLMSETVEELEKYSDALLIVV